jgi:hypothetical protein
MKLVCYSVKNQETHALNLIPVKGGQVVSLGARGRPGSTKIVGPAIWNGYHYQGLKKNRSIREIERLEIDAADLVDKSFPKPR